MMSAKSILNLLAMAAVLSLAPRASLAEGPDLVRFRQLRAEGVAAANAADLTTAALRLAEARAILPAHPGMILMQAQVAEAQGDGAGALGHLDAYARLGLTLSAAGQAGFPTALAAPDAVRVTEALSRNARPVGRTEPRAARSDFLLLEGVAAMPGADNLLVSSIREHTIYRVDSEGAFHPYLPGDQALGVYGLAIDATSDRLWAAAAGSEEAVGADSDQRGRTELMEIELSSGRVVARHAPPPAAERNFGDVAVGPEGTVAVSDSIHGEVFLLRPGATALQALVPAGVLGSPQGMVFSPDGRTLLVADYSTGLHRIDLTTETLDGVAAPVDTTLIGVDGLALTPDGSVWAVQNGGAPNRVLRLSLSPDWRTITAVSVAAANLDDMNQPSGIAATIDGLVLIQQSQWSRVGAEGDQAVAVISMLPADARP